MRWLNFVLVIACLCARADRAFGQERSQFSVTLVAGRTLEYWISQIPSKDQSKSENAIRAVMEFGPDRAYQAVPVIMDRVRQHPGKQVDVSVRVNGAIALGYILGGYKGAEHKVVKDAIAVLRPFLKDG